jgi:hypothetical protein
MWFVRFGVCEGKDRASLVPGARPNLGRQLDRESREIFQGASDQPGALRGVIPIDALDPEPLRFGIHHQPRDDRFQNLTRAPNWNDRGSPTAVI